MGGAYSSSYLEDVIKDEKIDFVVYDEGEKILTELILYLMVEILDITKIDGIAYISNNKYFINKPRKVIRNLDKLPLPAWDMINFDDYKRCSGMSPLIFGV